MSWPNADRDEIDLARVAREARHRYRTRRRLDHEQARERSIRLLSRLLHPVPRFVPDRTGQFRLWR